VGQLHPVAQSQSDDALGLVEAAAVTFATQLSVHPSRPGPLRAAALLQGDPLANAVFTRAYARALDQVRRLYTDALLYWGSQI
jgi:hypothetical protein